MLAQTPYRLLAAVRGHPRVCRSLTGSVAPRPSASNKFAFHLRPVVQRRGIEVSPVRPHECPGFRVEPHRIERPEILQGSEKVSLQNRAEIDALFGVITEGYDQRIGPDNAVPGHAMDWM